MVGGTDSSALIRRCWNRLLTPEAQHNISLTGKNGKYSLKQSPLLLIVSDAVKMVYHNVTIMETETATKNHFQHSGNKIKK